MITKPIEGGFISITATPDHIYGLDRDGNLYYREKPPTTYSYTSTYIDKDKDKKDREAAEEKKVWKKMFMEFKVEIPRGGAERSAQASTEQEKEPEVDVEVDEPAHKVYKDSETVKRVQQGLIDKGFYKATNKVDGDLGKLTVEGIKAFQKSVNLRETGEIDLTLCNALGLNQPDANETVVDADGVEPVIELTSNDEIKDEDNNDGFISA